MDGSTVTLDNTSQATGTTSSRKGAAARPRNRNFRSATIFTSPPNPKLWQKLRERTHKLLIPARPVGKPPGVLHSLKSIVCASWLNILFICIPVSWAIHWALSGSIVTKNTLIFIFSILPMIPLVNLLGIATDELSLRVGETLARLINATLGNAVGLIFAIITLIKCELRVLQASLVGLILSNLLLVLGTCFFVGGLKYSEQEFSYGASQLNISLLSISVIALLLPAALHFSDWYLTQEQKSYDMYAVSHCVAVILLFIYTGYLAFQLYSHTAFYEEKGIHSKATADYTTPKINPHRTFRHRQDVESIPPDILTSPPAISESPLTQGGTDLSVALSPSPMTQSDQLMPLQAHIEFEGAEKEETPQLSLWMTIGLLIALAVLVAVTLEWLVESLDGLTSKGNINKEFIGIILLPIAGNAGAQVTDVTVLSVKDHLNITLQIMVGTTIQITLGVIPSIVILGWILGKPLTFLFDPYESIAMFLSIITVNTVIQSGKSNWLKGFILICLYLILAVTFWFYPGTDPSGVLKTCT